MIAGELNHYHAYNEIQQFLNGDYKTLNGTKRYS